MSDNKSPLIDILNLSGFKMAVEPLNFQLFNSLKKALINDSRSTTTLGDTDVLSNTIDTIGSLASNNTDDIEGILVRSVIENWSLSVLEPLVDAVNEFSDSETIRIIMQGYLHDASVKWYGNMRQFVESINPDEAEDFKALLKDWENTLDEIGHSDFLTDAFNECE